MKKTSLRVLSLLLCIFISLPLSSCKKSETPKNDDIPVAAEPAEQIKLGGDYKIVRGEFFVKSADVALAAQYVKSAVEAVYGETPDLCVDKAQDGAESEFEILIGDTDRKQSKDALKNLGVNDFTYIVESQNVIVICGGSPKATLEGAKMFCMDVLGYNAATKTAVATDISIDVGTTFTYEHSYSHENATVNGVDINDVTIAITSGKYMSYAYQTAMIFAGHTGTAIPIVEYKDLTGDEACVICIGATDRSGQSRMTKNHSGYLLRTSVKSGLMSIGIGVSDDQFLASALEALERSITFTDLGDTIAISLSKDDILGFENTYDVPNWYLESEESEKVADGVVYIEQTYVDDDGLPYKVYALTVDPAKATLRMGTSSDGMDYTLTKNQQQTTQDHMKAAVKKGVNVLAGINADFFAMSGDYHPTGLTVKEGVVIGKGGSSRPYFGFTTEGKAVIGSNGATAKTTDLVTAVGGSHIIVDMGVPKNLDMDDAFGYTSHPRTLAGIKEDGTLIFAVVDGRQPKISNGAPLARCAYLMISLGAEQAINLDGGGSSTMIIRDGDNYETKNSPSDGTLRKVYNSVLIVGK